MFSKSKTTQNLINGTIDTLGKKKKGVVHDKKKLKEF